MHGLSPITSVFRHATGEDKTPFDFLRNYVVSASDGFDRLKAQLKYPLEIKTGTVFGSADSRTHKSFAVLAQMSCEGVTWKFIRVSDSPSITRFLYKIMV